MLEESILFLPKLKKKLNNDQRVKFFNYSSYPNRVEIDVRYSIADINPYLKDISKNVGMSSDELRRMLETFNRDHFNEPLFQISLPMERTTKWSYCAHIYYEERHFSKGILRLNRSYGQFPVQLNEIDHEEARNFYRDFDAAVRDISHDSDMVKRYCPVREPMSLNIYNECNLCNKNNRDYGSGAIW